MKKMTHTQRYRHSEESKLKISLGGRGRIVSLETRAKMSLANSINRRGKKLSEETKKKISLAGRGRVFSEEHKKRISESNKGKTISLTARKKISESRLGKPNPSMLGAKNPMWKGGITSLNQKIRMSLEFRN